jgi:two-component system, OmpR family, phosphate regulon sensor histidine kinase PhoR
MWKDQLTRALRLRTLIWTRWLIRTRAVWMRAAVALAVGLTIASMDSGSKFDLRFQLRGTQPHDQRITLIELSQNDWFELTHQDRNLLWPLKEVAAFNDAFFWHEETWNKLLSNLLGANPAAVAVTFFYPSSVIGPIPDARHMPSLYDPRVIWASRLDNDGHVIRPAFSVGLSRNTGLAEFLTDEDRLVRRFSTTLSSSAHIAVRIASVFAKTQNQVLPPLPVENQNINFRGPEKTFETINGREILKHPGRYRELLANHIVIIGTRDVEGHTYATPVGSLSRSELVANLVDNILNRRWIQGPSRLGVALYLLLLLIVAIAALQVYPQAVALVMAFWLALIITVGSIWLFDQYGIWLPVLAPLVAFFVAYTLFVGYQLTQQENLNWRLEEERRYLREIEQLKNNFVSLFSHDLKTPIAKIQAICDRLLMGAPSPEVQSGLQSLRQESSELHRYIQSILRVSRIESSDFQINKEPADINELIFKVSQQMRPLAEAKNIKLDTNLEPIFAIEVDPDLIQEVILNLVENAIKYSPENSTVSISSREVGDQVFVTVTDAGRGIPPQEIPRVFEKFFRGAGHVMSTKGSGLGLYLVKYFVELHGGRVFVRSEPHKGTRFGFALPLETAQIPAREGLYEDRPQNLDR